MEKRIVELLAALAIIFLALSFASALIQVDTLVPIDPTIVPPPAQPPPASCPLDSVVVPADPVSGASSTCTPCQTGTVAIDNKCTSVVGKTILEYLELFNQKLIGQKSYQEQPTNQGGQVTSTGYGSESTVRINLNRVLLDGMSDEILVNEDNGFKVTISGITSNYFSTSYSSGFTLEFKQENNMLLKLNARNYVYGIGNATAAFSGKNEAIVEFLETTLTGLATVVNVKITSDLIPPSCNGKEIFVSRGTGKTLDEYCKSIN